MISCWEKVLVDQSTAIQSAIELLEQYPTQIILVVDEKNKILGSLTDGDIRRAFLKHVPLSSPVSLIMNANPKTLPEGYCKNDVYALMSSASINHVPIVNQNNQVVGLECLADLLSLDVNSRCPVVIMAGGFGMRLRPFTDHLPKPMVKIDGKPILESIIDRFKQQGFNQFFITTHYMPEKIQDHFGDGEDFHVSIKYIHEHVPLGTAGALALLPQLRGDCPLIVSNGDVLTNANFQQLLHFHEQDKEAEMTVCVRGHDYQVPFGVIDFKDDRIINIVEKPIKKQFVNAGIYVLNASILNLIPRNQQMDMPALIKRAIDCNKKISMFPIMKYWKDVGTLVDFSEAENDLKESLL